MMPASSTVGGVFPLSDAQPSTSQWHAPSALDGNIVTQGQSNLSPSQQMHEIEYRNSPQINAVADSRMQAIATQLKGKISGRLNVKGPMEPNPLLRWPNENLAITEDGVHLSFDQLSLAQFGVHSHDHGSQLTHFQSSHVEGTA